MNIWLVCTFYAFIASFVVYVIREIVKKDFLRYVATIFFFAATVFNSIVVYERWSKSGHAPFSNLYESLVFFAWAIAIVFFLMDVVTMIMKYTTGRRLGVIGAIQSLLALSMVGYAAFGADDAIRPLMPALQSTWMSIHVTVYFLGYAALSVSFASGIVYLVLRAIRGEGKKTAQGDDVASTVTYDKLGYIAVSIGFPFLTFGIISGAVWAKSAWGTYWSWDPKETWSLITWLFYLVYLHLPFAIPRLNIKKTTWPVLFSLVLVISFPTVLFTYVGLKYLPSASDSEHIYGSE